ncbi:MAG: phosphoglycerate mutase family protein [Pseudomonadota bacterium]
MQLHSRLIGILLSLTLLAPCAALADPAVIYVLRHGEKLADSKDPALSGAGQLRAQNLAVLLRKTGIQAIFSSAYVRTRQTAQPLATLLGLEVQSYDAARPAELVARVKALGGSTLVVGHSNTVPELVRLFGGKPGAEIDEKNEFDRLYQLIVGADGSVATVMLTSLPANTP